MENQLQGQPKSVEVRAPYYVGVADLDDMISLWARARAIDEAVDPIMLVASCSTTGQISHMQTHSTCVSWISPTGTCFIWELRVAYVEGVMGPNGFSTADLENYKRITSRAAACAEIVKRHLESSGLYVLSDAAVARPVDMILLQANRPEFIVFKTELNCMEPVDYAE